MKKNKMPKFRPLLTPAAKMQTKSKQPKPISPSADAYFKALYLVGESKQ